MGRGAFLVALLLALFTGDRAFAQGSEAGSVVDFIPIGQITHSGGQLSPQVGTRVHIGDVLQTGPGGQFQLVLADQTKLVVGSNAALTIDQFVFNTPTTASAVTVNALRGAFRFITGSSPSSAYSIRTPVATLGVMGTAFDVNVADTVQIALLRGRVRACGLGNDCVTLDETCEVADVGPGFAHLVSALPQQNRIERAAFPWIDSQITLRPEFRLNTAECAREGRDFGEAAEVVPVSAGPPPDVDPPPPPPDVDPPPDPEPEPDPEPGNPGNGGPQGNAGADPGGNDMGSPGRGRSDNNGNGNG